MSEYDPNFVPVHVYFMLCVKVVIYNDDGRILLLKRSDKTPRAHGWDFAGGGVDAGEDPSDAAVRESLEETGLSIDSSDILTTTHGRMDDGEYVMIGYAAHAQNTKITISWEHEAYEWMDLDQASKLKLPAAHSAILHAYIARRR
jgi:8-oxo-dGTP pyrophosphatase MutT (NUDIX family)